MFEQGTGIDPERQFDLVATTIAGFEDVAAAELIEEQGLGAEPTGDGLVSVRGVAASDLAHRVRVVNRRARCVQRVGILLARGQVGGTADGLREVADIAASADTSGFVAPGRSLAIRARRLGTHEYSSPDVGRVVGQAVRDACAERAGALPPVDLDDPDVILRAEVVDRDFRLWVDTTGDAGLHERWYRRYAHMASMRPTLANLLLRRSRHGDGYLVDPLCGSATIPIEAALKARGVEPAAFRVSPWAWQRIEALAGEPAGSGRRHEAAPVSMKRGGPVRIAGVERFLKHVQGALENVALARLFGDVRVLHGDARELDSITPKLGWTRSVVTGGAAGDGLTVVTNAPFGRRVGSTRMLAGLYREVVSACGRAGAGRIVVLVERRDEMESALLASGYRVSEARPIRYGSIAATVFVADAD